LDEFLVDTSDVVENPKVQSHIPLSNDCINFESLFTRDDQTKVPSLKEEVSVRKVQETHKINIGTKDSLKYVNLGTSCTEKEVDQYIALFKEYYDVFGCKYDDLK
jgi:hypothetical protein